MRSRENTHAPLSHERVWRVSLRDGKISFVMRKRERERGGRQKAVLRGKWRKRFGGEFSPSYSFADTRMRRERRRKCRRKKMDEKILLLPHACVQHRRKEEEEEEEKIFSPSRLHARACREKRERRGGTNLSSRRKFPSWEMTRRDREVVDFTRSHVKNNTELTNLGN